MRWSYVTRLSSELARLDATAQAELVASGEVTSAELVAAALDRIERVNPEINAVIHQREEPARRDADAVGEGSFRGVPFLLKDVVAHSAGDPYHCGMRFLRDRQSVARTDTFLVQRFKQAGFVLVGRTNTPELAASFTTEPLAYGPTRNPWNPEHSPGGSSGGSAAAVAAGLVPVAHGNDMGGSVRVPAAHAGIIGLKGTRARTSLGPDFGELHGPQAHEGILARSVRDVARVLDVVGHPSPGDPYYAPPPLRPYALETTADPGSARIGFLDADPAGTVAVHPEVQAAVRDAARVLERLGHKVEEDYPEALGGSQPHGGQAVFSVAIARHLAYWAKVYGASIGPDDVEPMTWAMAEGGRAVDAVTYVDSVESLYSWSRRLASWWASGFDLLLSPTTATPAPELGYLAPTVDLQTLGKRQAAAGVFTSPHNVSGQPAISLPVAISSAGLPIGVQLVAAYGREDLLLQVSAQLEDQYRWTERRPAIHA
jgi:amidase